MSRGLLLSWITIGAMSPAFATSMEPGKSCLPAFTALQTVELIDPAQALDLTRPLTNMRMDSDGALVPVTTKVQLHAVSDAGSKAVNLSLRFDPEFQGVSLPYNLYAVMVLADGAPLGWWDYTSSCQGAGLSFFPGAEIKLPAVKLIVDRPQKLQIMVWGRL